MKKSDTNITIQNLKDIAKKFRDDRDWAQFHNPKELAIDMSIETGELLELFLWKSKEEIAEKLNTDGKFKQNVLDELADVVHACLAFANTADIDLSSAVIEKIKKTAQNYPIEKAKGKTKKYTEF
ncbi:MAG: nucleotide pyrophosphohydrolase [bacterium]